MQISKLLCICAWLAVNGTYLQSFPPNRLRGEQIGALFHSHSFCMVVVDVESLEDLCGKKIGQSCSAIALGSPLGALQKRIHANLSWSQQERCVFEDTFYVSTLETRRVCIGQSKHSKQCRSVSFHRPTADASLQKQWLVAIPLTNTPHLVKGRPCPPRALPTVGGRRQGCHRTIGTMFLPDSAVKRCIASITVGGLIFPDRRWPGLGRLIVDSELDASSDMPQSMVDSQFLRLVHMDMYSFEVRTEEHGTP